MANTIPFEGNSFSLGYLQAYFDICKQLKETHAERYLDLCKILGQEADSSVIDYIKITYPNIL